MWLEFFVFSIALAIANGFAPVLLLNDVNIFDQNEVSVIKLLFDPYSKLYQEINPLELLSVLDTFNASTALNTIYLVPPSNVNSNELFSSAMQALLTKLNDIECDAHCQQSLSAKLIYAFANIFLTTINAIDQFLWCSCNIHSIHFGS